MPERDYVMLVNWIGFTISASLDLLVIGLPSIKTQKKRGKRCLGVGVSFLRLLQCPKPDTSQDPNLSSRSHRERERERERWRDWRGTRRQWWALVTSWRLATRTCYGLIARYGTWVPHRPYGGLMWGLYRLWVLPTLELAFGMGSSKVLYQLVSEPPKKAPKIHTFGLGIKH